MRSDRRKERFDSLLEGSGITRRRFIQGLGAAGAVAMSPLLLPRDAEAAWPDRPITAVVMYAAGGGTDTVIRAITGAMAKATGWDINAINKPGAVGGVATGFVLKKPANGYWWLGAANYNKFVRVMGHSDSVAWRDWQYFQAANSLASWSVKADSPFKSLQDVIAAAKKNPGKLTISTSGVGGLWHEIAAIVAHAAGIELKFVPYKGGRPATLAGLRGEVDIAGGGVHEHIDFIRAGKLRNLLVTSRQDLDIPGYGKLTSVGKLIPGIKPILPVGGNYNIALRREASLDILNEVKKAFIAAAESESFKAICERKFFEVDVRWGEAADRRAAQLESLTAATFVRVQKYIGKKVLGPKELGLPEPAEFEAWWPPKGYEPRMT